MGKNELWPKLVFRAPPPNKRGNADLPVKPECDSEYDSILGDDKVYLSYIV